MKAHPLTRRTFLGSTAMSAAALAACSTTTQTTTTIRQPLSPRWPDQIYRRFSVDIHIPDWDAALLSNFDASRYVENMVKAGNQSLLQYTNSHVGLCLWPTDIGQRHAALDGRDFFGEVVQECRRHGIHPLAYYSLIHDNWAFEHHEDWRIHRPDGSVARGRYGLVCPNSPYREFVFSCIEEIASGYAIDGMFFDMTFWPGICYCPHCTERFRNEHGGPLPRIVNWDDPAWRAFHAARERWLLEFAMACTETAKGARPGITVNHQFSTIFHPWPNGVPLELTQACDYVGGDFYGGPAQQSLACKVYYSLTRTRPFEFHTSRTRIFTDHVTVKPMEEVRTEAYVATLHSAALMLVDYINVDGTVNADAYAFLGNVSAQRAVFEPFLGGDLLADVAIYFDKESIYNPNEQNVDVSDLKEADKCPHRDAVVGWARALQSAHVPFGVVTNVTLDQLHGYRAIVLPNVLELTPKQAEQIRSFVREGGVVFTSGPSSLHRLADGGPKYLLEDVFGVRYTGTVGTTVTYATPQDDALAKAVWPQDHVSMAGPMVRGELMDNVEVLASVTMPFVDPAAGSNIGSRFAAIHSNPPALQTTSDPAITVHPFGRGRAVWMAAPFESRDEDVNRALLVHLMRRVLPGPYRFEAETHPTVEITLFHQPENNRMILGLLHMTRELPALPVTARVRVAPPDGARIGRVTLAASGKSIPAHEDGEYVTLDIPSFETYTMFLIECII